MAYIFVRIGTDPTAWVLESTAPDTVAARLSQATGPVVLPIVDPLQGNLVVSPSAAPPSRWPGRLPSTACTRVTSLCHDGQSCTCRRRPAQPRTPRGTRWSRTPTWLRWSSDIIAAMSEGTVLSIRVADIQGGVVLLNGATLGFAVLAQVHG